MDFLDQARRWAVEATGLHHPSPTHRAPESPVYSPRIASPGLPRNLGEAVSRAVAAEARAASLQSALDRYVTQSEIMEKQVESLSSAMKRELENVTAENTLSCARSMELEGTAAALRSQLEALETALVETRAWAAEADAGRVRAEGIAAEVKAHAEKAWAETTAALARCAAAEDEAQAARASCTQCEDRERLAEARAEAALDRESQALSRAEAAQGELSAIRKELERLRLDRAASAVHTLSLQTSVAAGVSATARKLESSSSSSSSLQKQHQQSEEGELTTYSLLPESVGGGTSAEHSSPDRAATRMDSTTAAPPTNSNYVGHWEGPGLVGGAMVGKATSRVVLGSPPRPRHHQGSLRRFCIEVREGIGPAIVPNDPPPPPFQDLDSPLPQPPPPFPPHRDSRAPPTMGEGEDGVELRPIPSASLVVALDGTEERSFPANRVTTFSREQEEQEREQGVKNNNNNNENSRSNREELSALTATVASGSSALLVLGTSPGLADNSLASIAHSLSTHLFADIAGIPSTHTVSIDVCLVRQALVGCSELVAPPLQDVLSTREIPSDTRKGEFEATCSILQAAHNNNYHSPLSLSANLISQATHLPVSSPSDVDLLLSVGMTQAASLELTDRCRTTTTPFHPSQPAAQVTTHLTHRSHLVLVFRCTHTHGASTWTSYLFLQRVGTPGWVGLGSLPPHAPPHLETQQRVRREANSASGYLGALKNVLGALAREDRRERALLGAAKSSIRLKGRAAPASVAAAAATVAAAASPSLVCSDILLAHPLLTLLSPSLLANDATRQLLYVSLPKKLTYSRDADALSFLMLGSACLNEGILSNSTPTNQSSLHSLLTAASNTANTARLLQNSSSSSSSKKFSATSRPGISSVSTTISLPVEVGRMSRTPTNKLGASRGALTHSAANPRRKSIGSLAAVSPPSSSSAATAAAATTAAAALATDFPTTALPNRETVLAAAHAISAHPTLPPAHHHHHHHHRQQQVGGRDNLFNSRAQQGRSSSTELDALDAAIAAEAHSLADLHSSPLLPPNPQNPAPLPPTPAELVVDPVPMMKSLLLHVASHFPAGPRGLGVGGEGWTVLRGLLTSASAGRGSVSGPELATVLSRWSPSAFPAGALSSWSYVVGMGVATEAAVDVSDFLVGLEGLYRALEGNIHHSPPHH